MIIENEASAGTAESGDARVTVRPNKGGGLSLELRGPSATRYGEDIKAVAIATLSSLGVLDADVSIEEKGALDATIRARLSAAVGRAAGVVDIPWEVLA
ncbi:MAG: citrate lyase acyl carrier protein [Spirochaetae bacterium HGW-Spirochaetae-3]|jgi:citrate lyase subunit gamma (acyl carrier protein)|nr:MAG: citrate lyase acyl carrier protein [Spirochaetae bacterium HGW-Spirochaetae-3]